MKSPKDKLTSNDETKLEKKLVDIAPESKAIKKLPKSKKPKGKPEAIKSSVVEEAKDTPKNLSVADIAKIEKKKAKKQAQKLKKQQKKSAAETVDKKEPKEKEEMEPTAEAKSSQKKSTPTKKTATTQATKQATKKKGKAKKPNDKDEDAIRRERTPAAEAATIFVGNLPINTKRIQLVRLLQPYGTVHCIRLRTAGGKQLFKHKQRKGAGSLNAYVVLDSAEIAQKALALNGTEFKENHLRVTPAAKASGGVGGAGEDATTSEADAKRTIFVGNLKYSANEQKLREIFSSCGEIDYIRCLQDGEKGCKGVAYVCFQKPDAVGLALELKETVLDDRPIHVERYTVKKQGAKQARDSAAAAAGPQTKSKKKQNAKGATKRLDKKGRKENGKAAEPAKAAAGKKKSEYRGVKVDGIKKNKKPKKKTNNQMNALAKKIAPKPSK